MLILKSSFLESCTNMLMCSISPWYLKGNVYLKPFLPGIIKWAIVDYFFCMIEKIMLKSWMFCADGAIKLLKLKNNNDDEYLPLGSFAQTILQKKNQSTWIHCNGNWLLCILSPLLFIYFQVAIGIPDHTCNIFTEWSECLSSFFKMKSFLCHLNLTTSMLQLIQGGWNPELDSGFCSPMPKKFCSPLIYSVISYWNAQCAQNISFRNTAKA